MTDKDNGGPAFPFVTTETNEHGMVFPFVQSGMTLRDWFAGTVPLLPDTTLDEYAEALLGESPPSFHGRLEHARYWARVYAAYRYMIADAMMEARK